MVEIREVKCSISMKRVTGLKPCLSSEKFHGKDETLLLGCPIIETITRRVAQSFLKCLGVLSEMDAGLRLGEGGWMGTE